MDRQEKEGICARCGEHGDRHFQVTRSHGPTLGMYLLICPTATFIDSEKLFGKMAPTHRPASTQCSECRFWASPYQPDAFGHCALTRTNGDDVTVVAATRSAFAHADHRQAGYGAVLMTKAEFGCVMWERKH